MKNNVEQEVDVVRYFAYKDNKYLIYTMGEFDENNYQTLYVVKEMQELGSPILQTIRDDQEWSDLKQDIRQIIKEIKKGTARSFADLDVEEVNGLYVADARVFKLARPIVEILENNEDTVEQVVPTVEAAPQIEQPAKMETVVEEPQQIEPIMEESPVEQPSVEEVAPIQEEFNPSVEEIEPVVADDYFAPTPEIAELPNIEETEAPETEVPTAEQADIFSPEPLPSVEEIEPQVAEVTNSESMVPEERPMHNFVNEETTSSVEGIYQSLKDQIEIQEKQFISMNEENKAMRDEINNLQKINEEQSQTIEQLKSEVERYQVKWSEIRKLMD